MGDETKDELNYLSGFGNSFESEAIEGSLPIGRNNPRTVPFNLYTEQLSGSAFTRPRHVNQRTWLYRKQPSAVHNGESFQPKKYFGCESDPVSGILDPNPFRWKPFQDSTYKNDDFVSGMHLLASSGEPATKNGLAIYIYLFQKSMTNSYIYNSDGDFLIVPQEQGLKINTEMGRLYVEPGEICVLPRGITFSVHVDENDTMKRGYCLEVYKGTHPSP